MDYIKKSSENIQKEHLSLFDKAVFILQPFTEDIDITSVLKKIEASVPSNILKNVEVLYVADFNKLKGFDTSFNALYKDGAIYISNDQDNEVDLLDDILHEVAHSLEKNYYDMIFDDGKLETEFLSKRKALYYLVDKPTLDMLLYLNPEYDKNFDSHLYQDLGYDYLRNIAYGVFYSPYAVTSLREYWANGFENYLLGDKERLKDLSPVLYDKISQIFEDNEEY